jgi:fructose-1,6-bisphosphatase/inositol monophosphatase family enzyme
MLLVREAGGTVTDYAGTGNVAAVWNGRVVAGNEAIHRELVKALAAVK